MFKTNVIFLKILVTENNLYSVNFNKNSLKTNTNLWTIFSVFTVPETFYFPTWTVRERWANDERTLNARRT